MAGNYHHDMQQNGKQTLDEPWRFIEAGKQGESADQLNIQQEEDPWADIDEIIDLSQMMRLRKYDGRDNTGKYLQGSRERQSGDDGPTVPSGTVSDDGPTVPTGTVSVPFAAQHLAGSMAPSRTTAYIADKADVTSKSLEPTTRNTYDSNNKQEDAENLRMPKTNRIPGDKILSQYVDPEFCPTHIFGSIGRSDSDTNKGLILPTGPSYRADTQEEDVPGIYFFAVDDDGSSSLHPPNSQRQDKASRREELPPGQRTKAKTANNQAGPGSQGTNITPCNAISAASATTKPSLFSVPETTYHRPGPRHRTVARIIGQAVPVQPTRLVNLPKALDSRSLVHHSMETRPFFRCQDLRVTRHPADTSPFDSIQRPISAVGRRVSNDHSPVHTVTPRPGTSMGYIRTAMVNSGMVDNHLTTSGKHRPRPRGVQGEIRPALTGLDTPPELPGTDEIIPSVDPPIVHAKELPAPKIRRPKSVNRIQVAPYRDPDSHLTTQTDEGSTRADSSSPSPDQHTGASTDDRQLGQKNQNKGKLRRRLSVLRERLQRAGRRLLELATSCSR